MTIPALDYQNPAYWAVRPGADAAAALHPGGGGITRAQTPAADVFYLHPTTFRREDTPNQPIDDEATNRETDRGVMARQLSLFAPLARLFAPRYRQASRRAFREPGARADAAYALAYADIAAAFRHYLRHDNHGRPFILFSHSQGSIHAGRLLQEIIEPEGLVGSLIAAYPIGIGFSTGLFGPVFRQIIPATRPDQTGCLVDWNCFLPDGNPEGFYAQVKRRDAPKLRGRPAGLPTCINPLSFDARIPDVPAEANPGTLPVTPPGETLGRLVPFRFGARCAGGCVWVTPAPDPAEGFDTMPGGSLHQHDIAIFYASLQADVARRIAAHGHRPRVTDPQ